MKKTRTVTVEQIYYVCDYCGDEINDYNSVELIKSGKNFHNMKSGGEKGVVKKTCYEKYLEEQE